MSSESVIDVEVGPVARAAPPAGLDQLEGTETYGMDILGSPTRSIAGSQWSASAGQDINDEAQSVVSQAEGSEKSDIPEIDIVSCSSGSLSDDVGHTAHTTESVTYRGVGPVAQAVPPAGPEELKGAETYGMDILGSPTGSIASSQRLVSAGQDISDEEPSVVSQAEESGGSDIPEIEIVSCSTESDDVGHTTSDKIPQAENTTSVPESEDPRVIGDFDGSANEFWKLYRDEAKSHDDARINTLKEGMDSALIFAGLFSAVLTAFVIDSKQNLKPSSADETIYYLRQHSTILSQISVQLSSIAPQVAIPSSPPPPYPPFSPLDSDVHINAFWFMALAFSLMAALVAILVQQWVRNYMHVFQRYGDPLKSSRLRQYLYEGCERWHMRRVAEVVPGFLHISLFLFFGALGNSLLNIHTKVALGTIVPICVIYLLYIFTTFAPIIYPRSPYQNSFSSMFWYLFQKLPFGRRFRDRGSEMKSVSADMAMGQMQLAMEETVARKGRDIGSIRWLIENLTEDAEMEKFLSAIPGSFNTDWGREVWKRVGEHHESEDESQDEPVVGPIPRAQRDSSARQPSSSSRIRSVLGPIIHLVRRPIIDLEEQDLVVPRHSTHPPTHATTRTCSPVTHTLSVHPHSTTPHIQGENVMRDLSTRVARSVEICKTRKRFAKLEDKELWQKHSRACIETTALLHLCANVKLPWLKDITELLGVIGISEKIRDLSSAGTDELFVIRWTCLSLVAIRPILADNRQVQHQAAWAIHWFEAEDDTGHNDALAGSKKIEKTIQKAGRCLNRLCDALPDTEDLTKVQKILLGPNLRSQISELEQINIEAKHPERADHWIFDIQDTINHDSHQITSQIPGVLDILDRALVPFSRLVEQSRDPFKVQFMGPGQTLKGICSPATTLRNILEGRGDAVEYKDLLKNLRKLPFLSRWEEDVMQRQMWRLQDLRNGGGLGLIVELFFLAFSQLLSTSLSKKESHSALYTGAFRAITSDWNKHRLSLGTQNLLLTIAWTRRKEFVKVYPAYIVNEFLLLLGNIFKRQAGPHIEEARRRFEYFRFFDSAERVFADRVLRALTWGQAQSSQNFQNYDPNFLTPEPRFNDWLV